jgi:uncharacterized metal-binding protein
MNPGHHDGVAERLNMTTEPQQVNPLVYACSGCSSAAQMANDLALRLDRAGHAEMSCIAEVGGDVKPLVRTARSGRPIITLDGCKLHCVRATLARHGIEPRLSYMLGEFGVRKTVHADFDPNEADEVLAHIVSDLMAAELVVTAH